METVFVHLFELRILPEFASFRASRHNAPQGSFCVSIDLPMSVDVGTRLGSFEITALLGKA
jgi:hypothetical protein